jgi:hypothetical protein
MTWPEAEPMQSKHRRARISRHSLLPLPV